MALQCGTLLITGTIDDVCFYQMEGKYYLRRKSSLTRKRVLKDPTFQLTRTYAALLGEASKIASRVYRLITGEGKKHALYREITGKGIRLLREGKDKEAVFEILCRQYLKPDTEGGVKKFLKKEMVKSSRQKGKFKSEIPVPELKKLYPGTGRPLSPARGRQSVSRWDILRYTGWQMRMGKRWKTGLRRQGPYLH